MIQAEATSSVLAQAQEAERRQRAERLAAVRIETRRYIDGDEPKPVYGDGVPKRRGNYFGAKDADADLMTWAAQVNPNDEAELLALRRRIVYATEGAYTMEEDYLPDYDDEGELPNVCVLIQSVMRTLHDHAGILQSDLFIIERSRAFLNTDETERRVFAYRQGSGDRNPIVPISEMGAYYGGGRDYQATFLMSRFDAFLSAVADLERTVRTCPACGGLFAADVSPRRSPYCSPRCSHRAAVKRSDADKKSSGVIQ